jgi:hypothetical protein
MPQSDPSREAVSRVYDALTDSLNRRDLRITSVRRECAKRIARAALIASGYPEQVERLEASLAAAALPHLLAVEREALTPRERAWIAASADRAANGHHSTLHASLTVRELQALSDKLRSRAGQGG